MVFGKNEIIRSIARCNRLRYDCVMSNSNRPTLQDVADAAGVSTATVSRVINAPDKVTLASRDRINAVIARLGYTPNFGARALATNRTNTVGAIIPSMANAMFASGVQSFQETLAEAGVTLLIGTSGYDPDAELRQIRSLLGHGASGLLLIGNDRPQETRDYLAQRNTPHVISWAISEGLFVGFDNRAAAYGATREVLALGHRQIGIIAGHCAGNDRARDRRDGMLAALAEHKDAQVTYQMEAQYRLEAGRAAFVEMMAQPLRPTAIMCGNDVLAAGAMMGARDAGMRVPEDISIVGFDDIGIASVVTPPMTTVRVPQIAMGQAAARLLLRKINGDAVQSVTLQTAFIKRGSLGPAPKKAS